MAERRDMGELEHEVLAQLWAMDEPATPGEVLDALGVDLAYTTIMTILSRLWAKGLAERERRGRAYAYSPAMSEADLAAQRMRDVLATASDPKAALSRFVGSLNARELRALQNLLADDRRAGPRR